MARSEEAAPGNSPLAIPPKIKIGHMLTCKTQEYILKPEQPVEKGSGFGGWSQPQTIDPKAKMELLLNEGYCGYLFRCYLSIRALIDSIFRMWKETAKIFPEPPYGSLEMLERLFLEVEKNDPKGLDDLFPVVEKYAVYFYQSYNLSNASLDRLLDQVPTLSPSSLSLPPPLFLGAHLRLAQQSGAKEVARLYLWLVLARCGKVALDCASQTVWGLCELPRALQEEVD